MRSQIHIKVFIFVVLGFSTPLIERSSFAQSAQTNVFGAVNESVPDGSAAGLSDSRVITSTITELSGVRVRLRVAGEYNGDLYGYLRHITPGATNFCVLLNRPGKTASDPFGYDDAGLDVILDDVTPNGDIHVYRGITTPPFGTPLTGVWQPDGRNINPAIVTATTLRTTTLSSFAGVPAEGEWTLFLADLESGGTNFLVSWGLELSGALVPAVSWPRPSDIVYGTPLGPAQLNASAFVPGVFTYNPPAGTVMNAGPTQTLTVTFTPTDSARYRSVTTNVTINVLKKGLTITANNASKVYGAPLPVFSAAFSGFANNDTPAVLDSPVAFTTTATQNSNVGSYAIQPSSPPDNNYSISFVNGTLTIAPASVSGSLTSSANPALPGAAVSFTFTATALTPSIAVPSGNVVFRIGGVPITSPLANRVAVVGPTTLALGTHVVEAEFAGNPNFVAVTNRLVPNQLINTPPIAGPDHIQRFATNGTKMLISNLLSNDFDADADTLAFVSVSGPSANGGTVTRSGSWIYYAPQAGFTNDDVFTYTISDGRGQPVTGSVTVHSNPNQAPSPNLIIAQIAPGSYRIRFDGIPGLTYRIEYNDNVSPPVWQTLGSRTANDIGLFEIIDTPAAGSAGRFYRSIFP